MPVSIYQTIAQGAPGPAALKANGLVLPVYVVGPNGPLRDVLGLPRSVLAQWDPGSDESSVDAALLQQLGVPQVGRVTISTVQGTEVVASDLATLVLQAASFPISAGALPVLADSLPNGVRVLIGRDVGSLYRSTIDGPAGTWRIEAPAPTPQPPRQPSRIPAWLAPVGGMVAAAAVAAAIAESVG